MRARTLADLLRKGDRVAVSNITGREAGAVTVVSQLYSHNIVGGWALGKGGRTVEIPGEEPIPVFSTVEEMIHELPQERLPNKILVYSPPPAVYGDVKDVLTHEGLDIETIYVVTEHVSVEVTAKIAKMCGRANVDVLGCNSLGMINVHDHVRVGAVGGQDPENSFHPGSVAVFSNSGNMVNTMASYLLCAGMGTSFGISTGKDLLILFPMRRLLELAQSDEATRLIVIYVEPGGVYEKEALEYLRGLENPKPVVAYVTGEVARDGEAVLGHAGAVVEGPETTARAKKEMLDEYFGVGPFDPDRRIRRRPGLEEKLRRGIRIRTLHHLPGAVRLICNVLGIERDEAPARPLRLRPWFVQYRDLAKKLPDDLLLHPRAIPQPYRSQVHLLDRQTLGALPARRNMRNASHASSNDGKVTRIYGRPIVKEMEHGSFVESLLLAWTGERPRPFEAELVEKLLIASLSNGPGTISAQGAKLSASAGNTPNTAMIATLATVGEVHGGNGRRGVRYLIDIFQHADLEDPWNKDHGIDLDGIVRETVDRFARRKAAAKEAGTDYERIPCVGHPVFREDPVNYDPRERVIAKTLEEKGLYNVFYDFYHRLVKALKAAGLSRNVWAVNLDAVIACVVLGICWPALKEKRITSDRVCDIAFMLFALGRVAGAGGEYLDHRDFGTPMDMRIPVAECTILGRPRD